MCFIYIISINFQSIMKGRNYYYPHLHKRNGDLEKLIKFLEVTKVVRGNKGLTAFLVTLLSPDFELLCYVCP